MDTTAPSSAVRKAIPFDHLPWIRPLVHDYLARFETVRSFFAGDPANTESWRERVTRVRANRRATSAVAALVADQLTSRGAPEAARRTAAQLADPSAVAVVTGQQAGVFGGPLYTLLKAVSTIRVARHVEAVTGAPVVPVFWVDAEDHDWDEIRTCTVLNADFAVTSVTAAAPPHAGTAPVGQLTFGREIEDTLGALWEQLPATEYSAVLKEQLASRYRSGARVTTAFAGLLDDWLGPYGLVVFEADAPEAKLAVADLFAQEVTHPCQAGRLAHDSGAAMSRAGHAPQVVPADDVVSLFYLDDRGRHPIRYRDAQFRIGDEVRSAADLLAEVRGHPERFSPNVLLRPVVQDTLFPTVAYVGGPSELAYHGQLGSIYQACGVERPLVVSRASATLVDSAAWKFLDRTHLSLEAFAARDESRLNRLLESQLPPAVEAGCHDVEREVTERLAALKAAVAGVDPTLVGAVDTTIDRMRDSVKALHGKIVHAAKRKDETLRRQFVRTRALVFPDGHPQERLLGVVYFLNRYGAGLSAQLLDALPALPDAHLIVVP